MEFKYFIRSNIKVEKSKKLFFKFIFLEYLKSYLFYNLIVVSFNIFKI